MKKAIAGVLAGVLLLFFMLILIQWGTVSFGVVDLNTNYTALKERGYNVAYNSSRDQTILAFSLLSNYGIIVIGMLFAVGIGAMYNSWRRK